MNGYHTRHRAALHTPESEFEHPLGLDLREIV
jgi:hypothetical protein